MPWFKEFISVIGPILLAAALIVAIVYYRRRNRANDRITEKATRELYRHPETYDQKKKELEKEIRPS
jgi:hypothetical protein